MTTTMEEEEEEDMHEEQEAVVVPGQRLAHVEDCEAGEGTYVRGSHVYASIVGRRRLLRPPATTPETTAPDDGAPAPAAGAAPAGGRGRGLPVVVVEKASAASGAAHRVPRPGDVVTGVVVRVTPRVAAVSIGCVGRSAVAEAFSGVVRAQDVRATATEAVELYKAFRPGDVVRAEVLSLGDARSYFLSTARNDLGVVSATHSVSGAPMVPLSWNLMLCPRTNMTEPRKVAKLTSSPS